MKQETATGEISKVLGETLPTAIKFSYGWDKFESPTEIREAGKWPNDAEVLDYVNGLSERNAMSAARAKAQKDEVERISGTVDYKRRAFVETSVKNGLPRELAEGLAAQHIN